MLQIAESRARNYFQIKSIYGRYTANCATLVPLNEEPDVGYISAVCLSYLLLTYVWHH